MLVSMNRRMLGGDHSLNSQINRNDGEEAEWQDMLSETKEIIKKYNLQITKKKISEIK